MAAQESSAAVVARYRQNYLVEMDGIELYRALAAAEKDEKRAVIFRKMARTEERHARRWVRLNGPGMWDGRPGSCPARSWLPPARSRRRC